MKGNLFDIARQQLEKNKIKFTTLDVIDRAIAIRKRLDAEEVIKHRIANKYWRLKRKRIESKQ